MTDVNVAGGKAPYSFNQIRIDPHDDQTVHRHQRLRCTSSRDGGKTWAHADFIRGVFGDFRAMWWDPQDRDRIILGSDGGVSVSVDGGRPATTSPTCGVGEVYAVGVDMDDPYNVYAGFQDHDSWKGPSNGRSGRITLENWVTVGPGDGMYNVVDPTDSRWVYNTRELNQLGRHGSARLACATTSRRRGRRRQPRLRYNWIAPIALSPLDPQDALRRRAGALPLARSRRHLGRDQPRSDDERSSTKIGSEHAVLHDHDDRRVAGGRRA